MKNKIHFSSYFYVLSVLTSLSCGWSPPHKQPPPRHPSQFSKWCLLSCDQLEVVWWRDHVLCLSSKKAIKHLVAVIHNPRGLLSYKDLQLTHLSGWQSESISAAGFYQKHSPHHQEWRVWNPHCCFETNGKKETIKKLIVALQLSSNNK